MKQEISVKEKNNIRISEETKSIVDNVNIENRHKLANVFAWLIQEDKKQNPELYQIKKSNIENLTNSRYMSIKAQKLL